MDRIFGAALLAEDLRSAHVQAKTSAIALGEVEHAAALKSFSTRKGASRVRIPWVGHGRSIRRPSTR